MKRHLFGLLNVFSLLAVVALLAMALIVDNGWFFVADIWVAAPAAVFTTYLVSALAEPRHPSQELPRVSDRPAAGALTAEEAERRAAVRRAFGMVTMAEATENLMRNLGVPEPAPRPLELVGSCPRCEDTALHLLGEPHHFDGDGTAYPYRLITRTCRSCGHTWRERLDA